MADELQTVVIVFKGPTGLHRATYQMAPDEVARLANDFLERRINTYDAHEVTDKGGVSGPRRLMINPFDVLYIG